MKLKNIFLQLSVLCIGIFISNASKAQDTIVKTNGDVVYAKILEVGTNAVSYKRTGLETGPTFIEEKANIAWIKFKNGTKEEYVRVNVPSPDSPKVPAIPPGGTAMPNTNTLPNNTLPNNPMANSNALKNGPVSNNHIEHIDNRYTINGMKASSKAVDKLLAKSTNPAVSGIAKSAKLAKTFQKVIKITSIPTTIGGGVTSIVTFTNVYNQIKEGGASVNTYMNAGLSFLGTLSLPIASRILKNQRDKLYDKAIDLYNLSN